MNQNARRHLLGAALALLSVPALGAWPDRPIKLVVGFAPGGATDIVARTVAPEVARILGQQVVVENRPGANGNISNDVVAAAAPDGYTLLVTNPGTHTYNPLIYRSNKVDTQKAFTPVALLTDTPLVVVVPADSPARSLQELMARAKKAPDAVSYASAGAGAMSHLVGAMLQKETGAQMVHVPFKGSGQTIVELLAGRVDFMAESRSPSMPHIQSGRLRPLAVTGAQRLPDLPDVPTIIETRVANINVTAWLGVVAPAATPRDVVTRLHAAFTEAIRSARVQESLARLGTMPRPSSIAEFSAKLAQEAVEARSLVNEIKLTVD